MDVVCTEYNHCSNRPDFTHDMSSKTGPISASLFTTWTEWLAGCSLYLSLMKRMLIICKSLAMTYINYFGRVSCVLNVIIVVIDQRSNNWKLLLMYDRPKRATLLLVVSISVHCLTKEYRLLSHHGLLLLVETWILDLSPMTVFIEVTDVFHATVS